MVTVLRLLVGIAVLAWPGFILADTAPVRHDVEIDPARPRAAEGRGETLRVGRPSRHSREAAARDEHDREQGSAERFALLSFDLQALSALPVEAAVLRIFVGEVDVPGPLEVRPVLGPWFEEKVGEDAPPLGDAIATVSVRRSSARRFLQVDVTALVREWLGGTNPNWGLALVPALGSPLRMGIDSKENRETSHAAEIEVVRAGAPGPPGPPGPPGGTDPAALALLQGQIDELRARVAELASLSNPVIVTPSALPDATPGLAYNQALAATGGSPPYRWTVVGGRWPDGLSLDAVSGVLSGTVAATPGAYEATVQVADTHGHVGQKSITVRVQSALGRQWDVVFLVDTTGSMDGPIENLRSGIALLMQQVQVGIDPGAAFALAEFQDFPYPGFGLAGDVPYRVRQVLDPSPAGVAFAVNVLDLGQGGDSPESGTEALYLAATGEGVSWPGGSITPMPLGFQSGTRRVIALMTNAVFHDGLDYQAEGIAGAHSEAQAIAALNAAGISVVSLAIGGSPEVRAGLERYARATGATVPVESFGNLGLCLTGINFNARPADANGSCPLVFDVLEHGAGGTAALYRALELLAQARPPSPAPAARAQTARPRRSHGSSR